MVEMSIVHMHAVDLFLDLSVTPSISSVPQTLSSCRCALEGTVRTCMDARRWRWMRVRREQEEEYQDEEQQEEEEEEVSGALTTTVCRSK